MTTPNAPSRSILRQAVLAVLLLEGTAAVLLTVFAAVHETHVRYRALDATLEGRAAALLGAVGEADDPQDNVILDLRGIAIPPQDRYEVREEGGAVLGRSPSWPPPAVGYRSTTLHGIRVVDPGEQGGGKPHRILVEYAKPLGPVRAQIAEAIRFYAASSAAVLLLTAALLAFLLRRAFAPLRALTAATANLSAPDWQFQAPPGVSRVRELAPLSAAIEASIQRLRRSFEQQRRFTSDAAHELKTDVAIIKSSLQLLTLRSRSAEEYARGVAVSLGDCDRIEQTVQQMLTLARVEHTGIPPVQQTADLAAQAREAVRALAPVARLRDVQVSVLAPDACPVPVAARDAALLCANLLENAIRHSAPGGVVSLTVGMRDGQALLEVRDAGEGIPAQALPFVFEPFYRADSARSRERGGTGLGLAICKGIADRAGGSISLESRPGEGTLVSVCLPAVAAQVPKGEPTGARS